MKANTRYTDKSKMFYLFVNQVQDFHRELMDAEVNICPMIDIYDDVVKSFESFMKSHLNNTYMTEFECIEKYLDDRNIVDHMLPSALVMLDLNNLEAGVFEAFKMPTTLDDDGHDVITDEDYAKWCEDVAEWYDGRFAIINILKLDRDSY